MVFAGGWPVAPAGAGRSLALVRDDLRAWPPAHRPSPPADHGAATAGETRPSGRLDRRPSLQLDHDHAELCVTDVLGGVRRDRTETMRSRASAVRSRRAYPESLCRRRPGGRSLPHSPRTGRLASDAYGPQSSRPPGSPSPRHARAHSRAAGDGDPTLQQRIGLVWPLPLPHRRSTLEGLRRHRRHEADRPAAALAQRDAITHHHDDPCRWRFCAARGAGLSLGKRKF